MDSRYIYIYILMIIKILYNFFESVKSIKLNKSIFKLGKSLLGQVKLAYPIFYKANFNKLANPTPTNLT